MTNPAAPADAAELDQYVSIGRAASLLDCHVETLRRWERAGTLPAVRTPGGQRRFRLADLRQLLAGAR